MLKWIGFLLLTAGFLVGSLAATWSTAAEDRVPWNWYGPAFLLAVAGVVMARVSFHRASRQDSVVEDNIRAVAESLDSIVTRIDVLDGEKTRVDVYDLPERIDADFPKLLGTFVEARQSIAHAHGLNAYAAVMNEFAAGERYLNRVWSASVDGYIDEAHTFLERSRRQFTLARDTLRKLGSGS